MYFNRLFIVGSLLCTAWSSSAWASNIQTVVTQTNSTACPYPNPNPVPGGPTQGFVVDTYSLPDGCSDYASAVAPCVLPATKLNSQIFCSTYNGLPGAPTSGNYQPVKTTGPFPIPFTSPVLNCWIATTYLDTNGSGCTEKTSSGCTSLTSPPGVLSSILVCDNVSAANQISGSCTVSPGGLAPNGTTTCTSGGTALLFGYDTEVVDGKLAAITTGSTCTNVSGNADYSEISTMTVICNQNITTVACGLAAQPVCATACSQGTGGFNLTYGIAPASTSTITICNGASLTASSQTICRGSTVPCNSPNVIASTCPSYSGGTQFTFTPTTLIPNPSNPSELISSPPTQINVCNVAQFLFQSTPEAPSGNCTYGGVKFEHGLDNGGTDPTKGGNQQLDSSEISLTTGTDYICNGANSLVTSTECVNDDCSDIGTTGAGVAGTLQGPSTCPENHGGHIIRTCNYSGGASQPTNCDTPVSGQIINNLTKQLVCNGESISFTSTSLAAATDSHCPTGGQQTVITSSTNASSTFYTCNGVSSVVKTTVLTPSDATCSYGGIRIEYGLDDGECLTPGAACTTIAHASNGILDDEEIDNTLTQHICAGSSSLVTSDDCTIADCSDQNPTSRTGLGTFIGPTTCADNNGGKLIRTCTYSGEDAPADCDAESSTTIFVSNQHAWLVCNGNAALNPTAVSFDPWNNELPPHAHPTCPNGGQTLTFTQTNGNSLSFDICNGLATLMSSTACKGTCKDEFSINHCTSGGFRVEVGIDANGNGILEPFPDADQDFIPDTKGSESNIAVFYTCNGKPGSSSHGGVLTGASGSVSITPVDPTKIDPTSPCPDGGVKVTNNDTTVTTYTCGTVTGTTSPGSADASGGTTPVKSGGCSQALGTANLAVFLLLTGYLTSSSRRRRKN